MAHLFYFKTSRQTRVGMILFITNIKLSLSIVYIFYFSLYDMGSILLTFISI